VKSSTGFRLSLAALLALSLGTKAALSRPAADAGGADVAPAAVALLERAGYATSIEERPFAMIVHARHGTCRMLVAEYRAHGTIAEPLAALARPIGSLRFAWRGEMLEAAPKAAPLMHFFIRRELRRIGFVADHLPIVAVAASPTCPEGEVDWRALAALPA
jgi:hypothetical protein